jgi:hypothetical protein
MPVTCCTTRIGFFDGRDLEDLPSTVAGAGNRSAAPAGDQRGTLDGIADVFRQLLG